MRTTLTLDEHVARLLERVRRRGQSLRGVVNEALRRGLRHLAAPPARSAAHRTREVDLGRCRMASVDDVEEVLTLAAGERFP